jgi:hypothetical protein
MRVRKVYLQVFLSMALGAGHAFAATLEVNGPAEVPPASYTASQYVDSGGCVFVRAGYGSSVNWVARVGRDKRQLCGYQPSLVAGAPVLAVANHAAAPLSPIEPTTAAAAQAKPPAAVVPQATVSGYVSLHLDPTYKGGAEAGRSSEGLARIVSSHTISNAEEICSNLSPVAQRYMLSDGRRVIRCGPQAEDPVGFINSAGVPGLQVAGQGAVQNDTSLAMRVLPTPEIPRGYVSAWKDDRLNPNRGHGSAEGAAQMALLWSNEVPGRLLVQTLPYPAQRMTLSTKAADAAPVPTAAGGRYFVQVGSFAMPANAEAAKMRLAALGLSVMVHITDTALQAVRAGPFLTQSEAQAALALARSAGFSQAVLR